jgi:hypothetical protein
MEPRLISRGNIFVGGGKVAIAKLLIGGTLLDPYARVSHRVLLHRLSFSAQARHDARALGRVDLVPVEAVEEQDAQLGIGHAWVGFPKVREHECFGEVEHFAHHAHAVTT